MKTDRLEAFSDGVIAIIITVMVFNIKPPSDSGLDGLVAVLPAILAFVLSFLYLALYWNNHHHMFQAARRVSGLVLWANLHLLFWLSLFPFTTSWLIESGFATWPTATYGLVLLMAAIAYRGVQTSLVNAEGSESMLRDAIGADWKGKSSLLIYAAAISVAFVSAWAALSLYVAVAAAWLVPDRRIERLLSEMHSDRD